MDKDTVIGVLNQRNYSDIYDVSNRGTYASRSYEYMFQFSFQTNDYDLRLMLCVPIDWKRELFHTYIVNYQEVNMIPHLETGGKLCLFDLEGAIIRFNFKGILIESLDRMEEVLNLGFSKTNQEDYILEFQSYWGYLPSRIPSKSAINIDNTLKKTYFTEKIDRFGKISRCYLSDNPSHLKRYQDKSSYLTGKYFQLQPDEFVYPPDWRQELSVDYVNELLGQLLITNKQFRSMFLKHRKNDTIVISIIQPDGSLSLVGFRLFNVDYCIYNKMLQINYCDKVYPLDVRRVDDGYLKGRTGISFNDEKKKVLVIGCGSIGGYLVPELVKFGYEDIHLVDNDIFVEDNIYRHFLGMEYVGEYKTTAMSKWLKKNYPFAKIVTSVNTLENSIIDGEIDLSSFDLIFSAVGNHNFNRWLNNIVYDNNIQAVTVYLWNEVFGVGSHILISSILNAGCYNCLLKDTSEGIVDRTSYCEPGQNFTKRMFACGNTFMPYSSNASLRTVALCLMELETFLNGDMQNNILFSFKGSDTVLRREGFNVSARYIAQTDMKSLSLGEEFASKSCKECVV